ncbi:MAG TPA: T6SS immunity protein Tdi1 domain-containing protein [Microvirga sp.]|jgi:hypothetical protein|nr:T6SS immunity protein Tdi1 domain-containing protein [Microvirga sp.]
MTRALALSCDRLDCGSLRAHWDWLVPADHTPLLIGAFGDWVFGAPNGSYYALCLLEGDYRLIAEGSDEFNALKNDPGNLNDWFKADWVRLAAEDGLVPDDDECLGWKVHPMFGSALLTARNIEVYKLRVYQAIMGHIFRQRASGLHG